MKDNDSPSNASSPSKRSPRVAGETSRLTRRTLVAGAVAAGAVAAGIGGLFAGCRKDSEGASGSGFALKSAPKQSSAPEQADVRVGFVAVQSGAPIVAAYEKGFFKKHGLNATLSKENGWAAARDKVLTGENQASHLKYAQPLAATMGLLGAPKTPIILPWTLCRNGSVFMVASSFKDKLNFDPKTWKRASDEFKAKGEAFTIALPLPFGWHGLMYRHFLASAGINADKDLKLITLPPAQMVQNMKIGQMQACAMVEPWGARGVQDNVSVITMYGHEMWKDHPIKGLGMMESWADKNPKTARAIVRAIAEAAAWCDNFENRPELARMLSTPSYMNSSPESLLGPLLGEFNWGDGRTLSDKSQAIAYNRDNYPQAREIKWFIAQFQRWGMTQGEPDYEALAKQIGRPDIYNEAMKELGVAPHAPNDDTLTLWDGVRFDPHRAAEYAKSFTVHSLKG